MKHIQLRIQRNRDNQSRIILITVKGHVNDHYLEIMKELAKEDYESQGVNRIHCSLLFRFSSEQIDM